MRIESKDKNNEEKVPFNMSMLFYLRLSKIMELKDSYAINGDFQGMYRALGTIYRNVKFVIDETKSADVEKKLNSILSKLSLIPNSMINRQIEKELSKIDSDLMIAMHEKGMIFPDINTNIGLDSLYSRYGLNKNEKE